MTSAFFVANRSMIAFLLDKLLREASKKERSEIHLVIRPLGLFGFG